MQENGSRKVSVLVGGSHRYFSPEETQGLAGSHNPIEQKDASYQLEMRAQGEYRERNGKHYIRYEEISEDSGEKIPHLLKIRGKVVEHILDGGSAGHLHFEEGIRHYTDYRTPVGKLSVAVNTNSVEITENEEGIFVRVEYELHLDGQKVADTTTSIAVEFADEK